MASAATIGRNLGGQPRRHNWDCLCPLCGYALSLANGEDGRLLAHCVGGCDFGEIETALVDYGLYDDDEFVDYRPVAPREPNPEETRLKIEGARWLYQVAVEAPLVTAYLRSRGVAITSPVLRLLPQEWHQPKTGVPFPAMAAPVVDIAGEIIGIHLTFLQPDGRGLAYPKPDKSKGERDRRRRCLGVIRGGTIRLAPHDPNKELALAEGIENALSGMELHELPGWSTVSAGGLKTAEVPPEVQQILIIADHDKNGCGQRNAVEASRRHKAEGRAARIWMPGVEGDDANDFLMKRRG